MTCLRILLSFLFTTSAFCFEGILPYETTQLKSQAGAGTASLLINEATILNPASVVFTNQATLLYDRHTKVLEKESDDRGDNYREGLNEGIIIVDNSTGIKGGFNYLYQREETGKRLSYGLSLAAPVSKSSAMGVIISHNEEDSLLVDRNYTQFDLGYTQVLRENLIVGLTYKDVTHVNPEYSRVTAGIFYTLNAFVDLIADVGTGDFQNREKESFNRWALQLKVHERFLVRYGRFYDRSFGQKGIALGASWIGPRFSVDYAQKTSEKIMGYSDRLFDKEQIVESSIALTTLF